jgi:predicted phage terminase large subunit-like protein
VAGLIPWALLYLSHHFTGEPAQFHKEASRLAEDCDRLVIAAPRGHAKSTLLSLAYPLYRAACYREPYVLLVSDSGVQAESHIGNIFQELLENDQLVADYPHLALPDMEHYRKQRVKRAARDFITVGGLRFTGAGAGQSLRGLRHGNQRPSLILSDDLENDENVRTPEQRRKLRDWFLKSLSNLPGSEGGRIIVVGTILHHDSLLAWLLTDPALEGVWERRKYKAYEEIKEDGKVVGHRILWPAVWDEGKLDAKRREIGSLAFASEFLNEPLDDAASLFKRAWLQYGTPPAGVRVTMGVDLALSERETADFTAIVTVAQHEGKTWVLDAVRERLSPHAVIDLIKQQASKHNPRVINVESVQYQAMLVQQLQRETRLPVRGVRPDKDKVSRAQPLAVRYEQRLVYHAAGLPSWFEDELLQFPVGTHDDSVDALVYAWQGGTTAARTSQGTLS